MAVDHLWVEADETLRLINDGWYGADDKDQAARMIADSLSGESLFDDEGRERLFIARLPQELQEPVRKALPNAKADYGFAHRDIHWLHDMLVAFKRKGEAFVRGEEPAPMVPAEVALSVSAKKVPTVSELVDEVEGDSSLDHIAFNELYDAPFVTGRLPWDVAGGERRFTDTDRSYLFATLQERHRRVKRGDVDDVVRIVADRHRYNPLTDELMRLGTSSANPDGAGYAGHLLPWLLGAEDDRYTQQVTLAWMRMAVCRAFSPGCAAQWMPVLVGPQGCGKSLFARRMALRPEWFTDSVSNLVMVKELSEVLSGHWIIEIGELSAMKGKDLEAIKKVITSTEDVYRAAYGHHPAPHPRRSVFIGTTNRTDFLHDRTGNRRFYPIVVNPKRATCDIRDADAVAPIIRAAWGEIVAEYREASRKAGSEAEFLALFPMDVPDDVRRKASEVRGSFEEADDNADAISAWLSATTLDRVCAPQVASEALGIDPTSYAMNKRLQHELNEIMDTMSGWHRPKAKQRCGTYGIRRCWERDSEA